MVAKVVAMPEKVQKALGEEATQALVGLMNEVTATCCSTRVDRAEYDAHARLIAAELQAQNELLQERDKSLRAEMRSQILLRLSLVGRIGALGPICVSVTGEPRSVS